MKRSWLPTRLRAALDGNAEPSLNIIARCILAIAYFLPASAATFFHQRNPAAIRRLDGESLGTGIEPELCPDFGCA
jgi:hypothetical protein